MGAIHIQQKVLTPEELEKCKKSIANTEKALEYVQQSSLAYMDGGRRIEELEKMIQEQKDKCKN